jgi:hypothetical protein
MIAFHQRPSQIHLFPGTTDALKYWYLEGLGDQRDSAPAECIEHSQLSKVSLIPSLVTKVSPCFRFLGKALPVAIPIRHRVKNFKVPGALSSENFNRLTLEIFFIEKRVMIFLITRSSFHPCSRQVLQTGNPICSKSGVSFGRLLAGENF